MITRNIRYRIRTAAPGLFLASALLPSALYAHPGGGVDPEAIWSAWTLEPWTLAAIGTAALLYGKGTRRMWIRAGAGRGIRVWQAWAFLLGILALMVALISPLDALGGSLFSAHMAQHVVLMMVAAPLLALGSPLVAYVWALPPQGRVLAGRATAAPAVRALWRIVRHPVGAWLIHAFAVWIWHVPALYQATLTSEAVHIAQHLSFFGTALLFWWTAFEYARARRRAFGVSVIFVFTTAVHGSVLGALLTFSSVVWYPAYGERGSAWGLTPLEDQQLGGLLMWVPGGVIYLAAALGLLALGLDSLGRRRGADTRPSRTGAGATGRPGPVG